MIAKLEVEGIHSYYGTSHILFGISLDVNPGECVCLLGRNGVGKTTTLKTIMGLLKAKQGAIRYNNENLIGLESYEIARMGVGYVPDERLIFPDLTIRENLQIAMKKPIVKDVAPWTITRIYELFPTLKDLDNHHGGYLSGGEQQMLTIGRTLMGNPLLMLLDEPAEGLAPVIVQELTRQIKYLKTSGMSILFAEQNLEFATEVSDRAYVIDCGLVRFKGSLADLKQQPEIKEKYLMI